MPFRESNSHLLLQRHLWLLPITVFLSCVLIHIDLPGIYMDAVNPDFMAAQLLHHHPGNPSAGLPSKIFVILGSLYHGVQNVYAGLPVFALFGFSVATLRLAQAVFGVILLAALYHLIRRLTRSIPLALAGSLGLATELAFTASFRTQFYIVMGAASWLFVSLLLALPSDAESRIVRRRTFWSGVFCGLAAYGYFVLLFFVPAMLVLIGGGPRRDRREVRQWLMGFAAGLSPYALGYLSLAVKLHGIGHTIAFVQNQLHQLHPFAGGGANEGNLVYVWHMARLAVTNDGNDAMIFGHMLPSSWASTKFVLLVVATLLLSAASAWWIRRGDERLWRTLPGLLPVSYLLVSALFGHRLWAHHFCVLVPFVYLLPILSLSLVLDSTRASATVRHSITGILLVGGLAANAVQQENFQRLLARTGGAGMATDALTTLAVEARSAAPDVAYVFPEWGFFASFDFLTANHVRFVIDDQPETFRMLQRQGFKEFRLVYWNPAQGARYREILKQAGAHAITARTFITRDGKPAFYWLDAR